MIKLGIDRYKIRVLGNGVDLELFHQEERDASRSRWQVEGYVLISVGNLVPTKGHDLVMRALRDIPDACLLIAGRGPERERLATLAASLGVAERVRLVGQLSQDELRSLYSAADCLVLASVREGWPNVILEAMACGASVVASRVGGVAEILADCRAGQWFDNRVPEAIIQAVATLRSRVQSRDVAISHATLHGWQATTDGQLEIFHKVTGLHHA